jgi:hypothetical protein
LKKKIVFEVVLMIDFCSLSFSLSFSLNIHLFVLFVIRCEENLKKLKQIEAEAEKIEIKPPIVVDEKILTSSERNLLEQPKLVFEKEENKEFTVNTFLKMSELQV